MGRHVADRRPDPCPAEPKRSTLRGDVAREPLDEAERIFLEPVARYLAILQEWSAERASDEPGGVPSPEEP